MLQPVYQYVNRHFKLNGHSLNLEDLISLANDFLESQAEYEQSLGEFLIKWFDNSDSIELNTSGSTGTPKLIRIKKQAMVNSARATGAFFALKPGDRVLNCLPVKYVGGKMMVVRSLILGLEMDYTEPVSQPLKDRNTVYDFVAMVPLQAEQSLQDLSLVKKLIIGGAQINPSLEEKLIPLPTLSYATYGMTETVSHIALRKLGEKQYTVLPNVHISTDDRGCLVIDAPGILERSIVTNDLVELLSPTEFIFLGRADNIINSGGIKLFPEQIEEKLSAFISQRFFVTGKPDDKLGEKLVLVIEGKEHKLDESIFAGLSRFEKPKEIIFVPKFRETETGKIIRRESF